MTKNYRNGALSGAKVLELHRPNCVHCRRSWSSTVRPTIEHLTPKSQGWTNSASNLALACHSCNNQRGNLSLEEFYDGYAQFFDERKWIITKKVRKPRRWYHGDIIHWYP